MKKRITLTLTLILLLAFGFSAYSKDTHIAKDTLLYVKDPAGDNFLVVKVDECVLGNRGEVTCAMKPQEGAPSVQAGPAGSFFAKLAYPEN